MNGSGLRRSIPPRRWPGVAAGLWLAVAGWAVAPAAAQDASELLVRLNRIEGQMRQLSGQVEQLGHENRQLKEQLKRFQEDVEFRFQEQKGGRSSAPAPAPAPKADRPQRRSDAFDAETSPAAPGAPKALGGAAPARDGIASIIENDRPQAAAPPRQVDLGPDARGVAGLNPDFGKRGGGAAPAAPGDAGSRGAFETAYAAFSQRRYAEAEAGFRDFLKAHPRDRQASDAAYWLGESYLRQNKSREAAEQFLKVTQDHGRSPRAADAMLKLGVSLSSLGAKDQACATFAELGRKYPTASASVKQGVDREQKKARCPA